MRPSYRENSFIVESQRSNLCVNYDHNNKRADIQRRVWVSRALPVLVCQSVTDVAAPRQLELDHRLDAVQAVPKRTTEI